MDPKREASTNLTYNLQRIKPGFFRSMFSGSISTRFVVVVLGGGFIAGGGAYYLATEGRFTAASLVCFMLVGIIWAFDDGDGS